eukprot:COSAG06_NODE_1103_length_10693_cov_26.276760_4_plen_519_part_00
MALRINHLQAISNLLAQSEFVLEAFGNASTLNNENSSRFVKYLNLRISHDGVLLGATVHACLLERTRVCGLTSGKPFHIFRYLEEASSGALQEIDAWLKRIGFLATEVDAVHSILAAVRLLQQVPISEATGLIDAAAVPKELLDALGCPLGSRGRFAENFNATVRAERKDSEDSDLHGSGGQVQQYKTLVACQIKAGVKRTSKVKGALRKGAIVEVLERQQLDGPDGVVRLRIKQGWVTERSNDGSLLLMPYTTPADSALTATDLAKDQLYDRATTMRQAMAQSLYEGLFDTILQQFNTRIAYNPKFWNESKLVCRLCKATYILPRGASSDTPHLCYQCHKRKGIPPDSHCGTCGSARLAGQLVGKSPRCLFCRKLCCAECSLGGAPVPDVANFAAKHCFKQSVGLCRYGVSPLQAGSGSGTENLCYQCLADCAVPDAPDSNSLGILDIFGCERFEFNGLEQLCINYTNEKLHSVFLNEVFSLERQLYIAEGLDLATVGVHFQVSTPFLPIILPQDLV